MYILKITKVDDTGRHWWHSNWHVSFEQNWVLIMFFLQRTPLTEVTSIGDMRRTVGNLAGALHAYEVAEKAAQELTLDNFLIVMNIPRFSREMLPSLKSQMLYAQVHQRMRTLDSPEGVTLQKALKDCTFSSFSGPNQCDVTLSPKEVRGLIARLPEKVRWMTLRWSSESVRSRFETCQCRANVGHETEPDGTRWPLPNASESFGMFPTEQFSGNWRRIVGQCSPPAAQTSRMLNVHVQHMTKWC